MSRSKRVYTIAAALTLAGGAASSAVAQIPGMPLFTNPRYGSGIRAHVDAGKPVDDANGDLMVFQAGVSLAIGPLGLGVNAGTTKATAQSAATCSDPNTANMACMDGRATASALAQLRIMGGGQSNLSLSLFGGGSMDFDAGDVNCSGTGCGPAVAQNKQINIPVGVALGLRIPLGLASLNLWGAPRYNMTSFINCSGTCPDAPKAQFGWAAGADLPIFRVLSLRAAYDTHKDPTTNRNVSVIGVGASLGIGGMR